MNDVQYVQIENEEAGQRLDNFLIRVLKGVPKSHIYRIIRSGEVRVNKKRAKASTRLIVADRIRIPPVRSASEKEVTVSSKFEQKLRASFLYEDDGLLVINKPSGIAVHGGSGVSLGVIEALRKIRVDLTYLELVHRLDRETSGCLLLAKKRSVLRAIQALLEAREVKKIYWAVVANRWQKEKILWVDAPLQKNTLKSGERVVTINSQGKKSQTQFRLLKNYEKSCWVEASPKTGRTHQIRVHSAYIGHPIIGDEKYGSTKELRDTSFTEVPPSGDKSHHKSRLYLHAREIQFNLNGKQYCFKADVDELFAEKL